MATTLEAELREETGKGAGRRLRATGRVPGILYGHNMEPLKLSVSGQDSAPSVPRIGWRLDGA